MLLPNSENVFPYKKLNIPRVSQGDVFRDIELPESLIEGSEDLTVVSRIIPYLVVVSQDCDLEHDFNNRSNPDSKNHDKYLQNILYLPAFVSESVKEGSHFASFNLKMESWASDPWRKIKSNQNYRFHYLVQWEQLQIPELIIDFKHYGTISRELLYRQENKGKYLGSIAELFRENLSSRFAYYLSRVALPELPSQIQQVG